MAAPYEALSAEPRTEKWFVCPYEAEGFKGKMLVAPNGVNVPEVTIPLNAGGPHEIRLGIYYGHTPFVQAAISSDPTARQFIRVRLSDEHWFDVVESEQYARKDGSYPDKEVGLSEMLEVRWRCTDLGGRGITIAAVPWESVRGTLASLAYVRLVPLEGEKCAAFERERVRDETKRLVAIFDGTFYGCFPSDEDQLRSLLEPMRESDFALVLWATSRLDACYYFSNVGTPLKPLPDGVLNRRSLITRSFQAWVERGDDPLEVVTRIAHECGLSIYGSMRLAGIDFPPYSDFHGAPTFMQRHPEFWCVDENGSRVPHVSLTFPEVRQLIVSLFREQVERYDLDGVHLLFNRSFPFVLYEKPFVKAFAERYGTDPRALDRMDERLWNERARYVTALLRELRQTLDEVGTRRGRRLGLAVHVLNSVRHCRYFGLDVGTWAREGLVEHVVVFPCHSVEAFEPGDVRPELLAQFVRWVEGTDVRVYADVYPRRFPPERILERGLSYYRAGVDGLCFWDTYARLWRKSEWAMIRLMGHRNELGTWREHARSFWRKVPVRSIHGISLDRRYGVQTHG
jgi:hypothetical protein